MSEDDYRRGMVDAKIEINEQRHIENQKRLEAIEKTLVDLASTVAIAKGGFRILFAVGSASATIGIVTHSALSWLWSHWK